MLTFEIYQFKLVRTLTGITQQTREFLGEVQAEDSYRACQIAKKLWPLTPNIFAELKW